MAEGGGNGSVTPSPSPPRQHDWSAHRDDDGTVYYHNSVTGESAWEPPPDGVGFNPLEEEEEEGEPPRQHDWSAHYDDEGQLFYHNSVTDETSWEPPPDGKFNPPEGPAPDNAERQVDTAANGDEEKQQEQQADGPANEQQAGDDAAAAAAAEPMMETDRAVDNNDGDEAGKMDVDDQDAGAETSAPPLEEPAADEGEPSKKTYDWSAHYDDEGRLYYYNAVTEESAWEPPEEGFNPPEEGPPPPPPPAETTTTTAEDDDDTAEWVAYQDEEGREYYFNSVTGETQWEKPAKYRRASAEETEGATTEDAQREQSARAAAGDESKEGDDEGGKMAIVDVELAPPEAEIEPEIDPAVQRLKEAEAALNSRDSVLEPSCIANVLEVAAANEGNQAKGVFALIENYHGQTAVCGLLGRWLMDLNRSKKQSATPSREAQRLSDLSKANDGDADKIRETVQNVINKIAKERFTEAAGDSMMRLSKTEAAFLQDMMDSPRWRKLLIDLVASHKDSAVLVYCLNGIAERGHHREIAQRINISEHFFFFDAMLRSELATIGGQAVSAGSDVACATGMDGLIRDLLRTCSATSYTYLYSVQVLRTLERMALEEIDAAIQAENGNKKNGDKDSQERFRRAVRKWSGLGQLLENCMMDPSVSMSAAGSSPLFRKRQLDVALTISDLNQREKRRRRIAMSNGEGGSVEAGENGHHDDLESALATLLRRHATGIQLDDAVLDRLLPSGLDLDTRGVGHLLIQHPLAVRALLGHLYKPGPSRVTSPSTKNKCARLIALAVIAAEESAKREAEKASSMTNGGDGSDSPDEVALARMIAQGSQLCEELETSISFLVTKDPEKPGRSPGEKLCSLALKCAPVALGVVAWAREFTHGPEYATSASFPTLSSSILSLVRLVAMRHPFARDDALHVALAFLRQDANPDISYQKVNAIKECSLRLLIFLLTKGDIVPVFANMSMRLKKSGAAELDTSLIRYFVAGVLEVVKPPVSPVFVRMFGGLLKEAKAVEAVKSTYFGAINRERLTNLLKSFKDVRLFDGSPLPKTDELLVSSVLALYQIG